MAKDPRQRQKAAEKRKRREIEIREQKARQRSASENTGLSEILADASDYPVFECVISEGWRERGLAHILLARTLPGGKLLVGGWYVDTLCLGIKDAAVLPGLAPEDYQSRVKPNIFHDTVVFEPCEPGLAKKIAEGAAEFAEKYTFKPSKRWPESRLLFAGLPESSETVEFGREGKPCYVNRGESNAAGIIARLSRNAPEGGYLVVKEEKGS
jgi:hypothetical protein